MLPVAASPAMNQVSARRAIEALRAGVPNRDAVSALPSAAPAIDTHFQRLLGTASERGGEGPGPAGFLLAGNFGAGKSHLLESLQHRALEEHFVTSKLVISKETPLYDPLKMFRAAMNGAQAPGRRGALLAQIVDELNPRGEAFLAFSAWVQQAQPDVLNQRFAASLLLFEHARHHDPELYERILAFWAGDPIGIGDLKRALRAYGEPTSYMFDKIDQRTLALQRFRFAARLIRAAGFHGWVLLIDEVELIGRYSLPQRARSYAEVARWTGGAAGEPMPGLLAVLAVTSDYEAMMLDLRNDRDNVPNRLRASTRDVDQQMAPAAERGMRAISRAERIPAPTRPAIRHTYEQVRDLHARAYTWEPPAVGSPPYATSTSMREYIRWWITEWDLRRLYPDYIPSMELTPFTSDYSQDSDLEGSHDRALPGEEADFAPDGSYERP